MSLAEKLQTIAENEIKVYDKGFEDGKSLNVDYLPFVKTVQFHSLNDLGKAEVELNLDNCESLDEFCCVQKSSNVNTTVEHLTLNNCKPTSMKNVFKNTGGTDYKLKHLTLNFSTKNVTIFQTAFNSLMALEIIDGTPLDFSSATGVYTPLNYLKALKEVRFEKETLSKSLSLMHESNLSTESIQSIIDGLADLTGATTQTLTIASEIGDKITDTQKATITAKNWTLAF